MDVLLELIKLGSVGVLAGAFASFLARHEHRNKNHWERRASAYQETIEALSDLVFYYERYYTASLERREINEKHSKDLSDMWKEAHAKVRRSAHAGAFLFSDKVNEALSDFMRSGSWSFNTLEEHYEFDLTQAEKALKIISAQSKDDLKLKQGWL